MTLLIIKLLQPNSLVFLKRCEALRKGDEVSVKDTLVRTQPVWKAAAEQPGSLSCGCMPQLCEACERPSTHPPLHTFRL